MRTVFEKPADAAELIGVEVEAAALDEGTGRSVPYGGPQGIETFLGLALDEIGGTPVYDRDRLIGLQLPGGGQVSLEHGGAIEYSSPAMTNLVDVVDDVRLALEQLASVARHRGFALVPGANYPFTSLEDVRWVPHGRGPLMRRHFASCGRAGEWGPHVMALTLSTQATFDYTSPKDFAEKLRVLAAASTVASALFVNSPLENGTPCGALSRRMQYWTRADPIRAGIVPCTIQDDITVDRYIEWAASLPMMFRKNCGAFEAAPATSFSSLIVDGFKDGSRPTMADWHDHLWQIISCVRVRDTLEVRAPDGPPWASFASVPAFWMGLTYHSDSRAAAWELLRSFAIDDHRRAHTDIAQQGLAAVIAGCSVRELAGELLRLSKAGLQARVDSETEAPGAMTYLEPLEEILSSGSTFADRCLLRWAGDLNHSPEKFVDAFRI